MCVGAIMKTGIRTSVLAVLLAGFSTVAYAQKPAVLASSNGRSLVASNALKLSADTERSGAAVVAKRFLVPFPGTVRVKWQIKSDGSGQPANLSVSTQIGTCSDSHSGANYKTGACDIRVVAGDIVEVSARGTQNFTTFVFSTAFMRNVRVFYNVVDSTGAGQVLND